MRTVILASHGHLASGMKNTVEMILGEQEALKAFDAYTTPECNVHDLSLIHISEPTRH